MGLGSVLSSRSASFLNIKIMKKLYAAAFIIGLCALPYLSARAESPPETLPEPPRVFISEINWAGSSNSTADEWIELFNASGESVDLGGWVLTGAATSGDALSIAEGFTVEASDAALISNYPFEHEKTTLGVEPDLVTSALSLPNNSVEIMLTTPEGLVVDEVAKADKAGSTNPITSMTRLDDLTWAGSTESVNLLDSDQLGTPGVHMAEALEEPEVLEETEASEEAENPEDPEAVENNQETVDSAQNTEDSTQEEETLDDGDVGTIDETEPTDTPMPEADEPVDSGEETETSCHHMSNESAQNTEDSTQGEEQVTSDDGQVTGDNESAQETVDNAQQDAVEAASDTRPPETNAEGDEQPQATNVEQSETTNDSDQIDATEVGIQPTYTPVPTPEPTPTYSRTLQLSEIVSDPADGTEWVEIVNTGSGPVNLLDFGVMDASGKLTTFPAVELNPRDFYIVEDPAGNLNNSGDAVHLFDPSGFVIDEMSYGDDLPAPGKGESLAFIDGEWMITSVITRAEENALPEVEDESNQETVVSSQEEEQVIGKSAQEETVGAVSETHPSETNAAGNKQPKATNAEQSETTNDSKTHKVVAIASEVETKKTATSEKQTSEKTSSAQTTMTGVVTALPGTFGGQIAFINGTQVYFYYAEWPYLELGDLVTVTGEPSENRGESRIKISAAEDIKILNSVELTPMKGDIGSLGTLKPGALVQITGSVVEQNGDRIVLKDKSGEVEVVAYKNTGVDFKSVSADDLIITGVLRKFGDTARVYPRSQADVATLEKTNSISTSDIIAPIARTQSRTPWIGGGLAAGALAAVGYWYAKHRLSLRTA